MKSLIHIADRDARLCSEYRLHLKRCGFDAEITTNGIDCLTRIANKQPDILILGTDLLWGGADGVLKEMQHCDELSSIPVLLLANQTHEEETAGQFYKQVSACLEKPFRMADFLRKVRTVAQGTQQPVTS